MKDFDQDRRLREDRDRSFIIAGETFVAKPSVAPEAVLRWGKMSAGEYYLRDSNGSLVINPATDRPLSELTEEQTLEIFDETILAFLEAGQEEKWLKVRDINLPNPLSVKDLGDIVEWLWEQESAHPTGEPSGSTPGSDNPPTGPSLTGESPLQAVSG